MRGNLTVCVFCASSDHVCTTRYAEAARHLGCEMAARGIHLVYGGGNNGLMGVLAEEIHRHGGKITGVIPLALKRGGYAYDKADEIIVTNGLRERKTIMEARADGFIGLPGGFGTIEEMIEIIALRQLGMHAKPIVFLNIGGFFNCLLDQFEHGYRERFIPEECRTLYTVAENVPQALDAIRSRYRISRSADRRPP